MANEIIFLDDMEQSRKEYMDYFFGKGTYMKSKMKTVEELHSFLHCNGERHVDVYTSNGGYAFVGIENPNRMKTLLKEEFGFIEI